MSYVLRKEKLKRGLYFKVYFNYREPGKKYPSNKYVRSLGYAEDLMKQGIPDPLKYCQKIVQEMNDQYYIETQENKYEKITNAPNLKYISYFPLRTILKRSHVRSDLEILAMARSLSDSVCDCLEALIYARAVDPCSIQRTVDQVIPSLFESSDFSYHDILSGLHFSGIYYDKITEIFFHHLNNEYSIDTSKAYFYCINYNPNLEDEICIHCSHLYIDNGNPSVPGAGVLLDAHLLPIWMKLYSENKSETSVLQDFRYEMNIGDIMRCPYIVLVADPQFDAARDIHNSLMQGNGYIFSRSVKECSEKEKTQILKDGDYVNSWKYDLDPKSEFESYSDTFHYKYQDNHTGQWIEFSTVEKRVVLYNQESARKQKQEIRKLVKEAQYFCQHPMERKEIGECGKYIEYLSADHPQTASSKNAAAATINWKKIYEDLRLCGFYMLVTSETDMDSKEIRDAYDQLSCIHKTFDCMDIEEVEDEDENEDPDYVDIPSKIKGQFLIRYLAMQLERIFQFYILENTFDTEQIHDFFNNFRVAKIAGGKYSNTAARTALLEYLAVRYALPVLHTSMNDADIKKIFKRQL